MKLVAIIVFSLSIVSCSSVTRLKPKTIKAKTILLNPKHANEVKTYDVYWFTGHDLNCFEDDNGNEIITVHADNIEFAIMHFYKQNLMVDVRVTHKNYHREIAATYKWGDKSFELETAMCVKESFSSQHDVYYISFRKVK